MENLKTMMMMKHSIITTIHNGEKYHCDYYDKQLHKGGDPKGVSNRYSTFVVSNFSDTKGVRKIYKLAFIIQVRCESIVKISFWSYSIK